METKADNLTDSGEPKVRSDALFSAFVAAASVALLKVVRRAVDLEEKHGTTQDQAALASVCLNAIEEISRISTAENDKI